MKGADPMTATTKQGLLVKEWRKVSTLAAMLLTALAFGSVASVWADVESELAAVRAATAQFHRVDAALDAGYVPSGGCVELPGVGGMGYHYVNFDIRDLTVDALAPEAMVYAPGPSGQLQLAAVEYMVYPADAWDAQHPEPPSLFGETFHRNQPRNRYDLHVWIWNHNPTGMFEDWNPTVSCSN
jgi:hypothetical protein